MRTFTKLLAILALSLAITPAFASKKDDLINKLLPSINAVNTEIKGKRAKLISLETKQKTGQLTAEDKTWLNQLATDYRVTKPDFNSPDTWKSLELKVDVIPPSLAIAQAATESGWGSSRFAKKGNNYFGQSCFKKGCGIKPNTSFPHGYYEVQRFGSVNAAVRSYINNLNTHRAYTQLRQIRSTDRNSHQMPNSLHLLDGRHFELKYRYPCSIFVKSGYN